METSRHSDISVHPDTFLYLDQLGAIYPEYRPTFPVPGQSLNPHHRFLFTAVNPETGAVLLTAPGLLDHSLGKPIQGWLRTQDALKLYEMAYFCRGDIMELGTYEALSTCIMAQAVRDAGHADRITSIDIEWRDAAEWNAHQCGLDGLIDFRTGDAVQAITQLPVRHYGFIFVDHSHRYDHVKAACELIPQLLTPGGFVLFHDYNDPRNGQDPEYGVYQAVTEGLPPERFDFCGVYGCTALYRAQLASPQTSG